MGIKWEITDWNKSQGLSWEMTFMDPGPLSSVRQSEVLAGLKNAAAQLCKEKLWQKSPKQIFCKVGCGGKAALTSPLPSPALLALSLVLCHTGPCLCQGCSLPWVTQDAPGSSQGVDMVIQAKKKKKNSPVYCISRVKLMQTRWVKTFFLVVTPPGQPNIIYAPYGEHWREGWRGFVWKALSGTTQTRRVGPRGLVHTELSRCVCKQDVTADNSPVRELPLDRMFV